MTTRSVRLTARGNVVHQWRIMDGNLAAPALCFRSAGQSGMYHVGNGALGVVINGTQRLLIDAGNVSATNFVGNTVASVANITSLYGTSASITGNVSVGNLTANSANITTVSLGSSTSLAESSGLLVNYAGHERLRIMGDVDGTKGNCVLRFGSSEATLQGSSPSNTLFMYMKDTGGKASIGLNTYGPDSSATLHVNGNVKIASTLNFGSQVGNTLLTLYGDNYDPNVSITGASGIYSFGINASVLRYQCPAAAEHRFYSGTTQTASFSSSMIYFGSEKAYFYGVANTNMYLQLEAPTAAYQTAIEFRKAGNQKWVLYNPGNSDALSFYSGPGGADRFTIESNGTMWFANDVWHKSSDGKVRLYFANNGPTYFGTGSSGYVWRSSVGTDIMSLQDDGRLYKVQNHVYGLDENAVEVEMTTSQNLTDPWQHRAAYSANVSVSALTRQSFVGRNTVNLGGTDYRVSTFRVWNTGLVGFGPGLPWLYSEPNANTNQAEFTAPNTGPVFKQFGWDSPGSTHELANLNSLSIWSYDNFSGVLIISASNRVYGASGKNGILVVAINKASGVALQVSVISTIKGNGLATLTIDTNLVVSTDSDCRICYTLIGGY